MTRTSAARHRVVIVGSGFGGLFAAKSLGRAPDTIEVTLISRTNHHLFQPLLYQVATGILSEGEIAPATRDVLKKKKNVSVELAEVTGFDLKARHVTRGPTGRTEGNALLRQPNRRCGRRAVVLRARRVLEVGARNENARGCTRSTGTDIRRVRDGRAGGRPGDSSGMAHVRRRRRWPDRRRDSRPDRGAVEAGTQAQFPAIRLGERCECSCSKAAQRSWPLSETSSPGKRPASWRGSGSRST